MSNRSVARTVPKLRFPEFRGRDGWEVKPFQKLFTIGSGRDYKHLSTGSIPVYGSGGYMLSVDDFLYDGESVCIGRKGTINNPMFLAGKFWTVDTLFYTHSFQQCLPKFVYAVFQQINWLKHNEAGGVPSLSKAIIEKIETAVPEVSEQQKIADCLSSLDELIAAQARKVDALKTHKKGLMQQLFPREGETQPRLRFPEFRDSGEWDEKPLGDISEIVTGKTPSTQETALWGGHILFITPTDISDDVKYQRATARTVVQTKGTKVLPEGTIIYTCIASIGKMALTVRPSITNQQINAVVPKEKVTGEFIYYALVSLTPWIKTIAASSTLPIINKTEFSKITLVYPLDKSEQQRITDCLTSLDDCITLCTQELETLKTHKKGLMQQLFPQNVNEVSSVGAFICANLT